MTYLEFHTDDITKRFQIEDLPGGRTEEDFMKRLAKINEVVDQFYQTVGHAFPNAKIYIVHQPKIESHERGELEPDTETVREDEPRIYDGETNGHPAGGEPPDHLQYLQPERLEAEKGAVGT